MTETNDPWQDPGWLRYAQHFTETTAPGIVGSAISMMMVEGAPLDPRLCCELGGMIMLDKPIIAVVSPGVKAPAKLILVADEIVEGADMNDEDFRERLMAAIGRVQATLAEKKSK